ncbi:MAG: hydrogenase [Selenomonadales bacterium]|nr:hydrogenase [Selenomonadales bacterium]
MDSFLTIVLVMSALLLFRVGKVADAVAIIALQSGILAACGLMMWWQTGIGHLLTAAVMTLAVKVIVIPLILYSVAKGEVAKRKIKRIFTADRCLFVAIVLMIVGYHVASYLDLPATAHGQAYLESSIILLLLGTFTMIAHNHPIMQGIGLITIENAIFLITIGISYGMPLFIEIGILFDMLISAGVIATLTLKIYTAFHSVNTSRMRNLKG